MHDDHGPCSYGSDAIRLPDGFEKSWNVVSVLGVLVVIVCSIP